MQPVKGCDKTNATHARRPEYAAKTGNAARLEPGERGGAAMQPVKGCYPKMYHSPGAPNMPHIPAYAARL
jgi:hypothetical protein